MRINSVPKLSPAFILRILCVLYKYNDGAVTTGQPATGSRLWIFIRPTCEPWNQTIKKSTSVTSSLPSASLSDKRVAWGSFRYYPSSTRLAIWNSRHNKWHFHQWHWILRYLGLSSAEKRMISSWHNRCTERFDAHILIGERVCVHIDASCVRSI
jgi:hypothetical protein